MTELKKRFEDKFVEYEICDNPDHGFIKAIPGDISRLGCPACGHDDEHRILSTASIKVKPSEVWQFIEVEINNARMEQDIINFNGFLEKQDEIIRQAKIDENKYWTVKTDDYIATNKFVRKEQFESRIKELETK